MKLKIQKAIIYRKTGITIEKPDNLVFNDKKEIENYRRNLREIPENKVLFTIEEIE